MELYIHLRICNTRVSIETIFRVYFEICILIVHNKYFDSIEFAGNFLIILEKKIDFVFINILVYDFIVNQIVQFIQLILTHYDLIIPKLKLKITNMYSIQNST